MKRKGRPKKAEKHIKTDIKANKRERNTPGKKKKSIDQTEIAELCKLPLEEMKEKALSLDSNQQETIYRLLSQPPNWIKETANLHENFPDLSKNLPSNQKVSSKITQIISGIMISAGDIMHPNPQTVQIITEYIHKFIKAESLLSPNELKEKYSKLYKKLQDSKDLEKEIAFEDELEEESDEEMKEMNRETNLSFERLEFNDLRTKDMNPEEYQQFSACRRTNFSSLGKKKFLKWSSCEHSFELLAQVAWDKIYLIIENAIRKRNDEGKLTIQNTAISPEELDLE